MLLKFKTIRLIILLISCSTIGLTEKIATFSDLIHPKNMVVDGNAIYITDYPSVYIYSLKDYHLVKKFGRKGQGPGEFYIDQEWMDRKLAGLISFTSSRFLYVNSMGKLSIFDRDGHLKKELKVNPFGGGYYYQPLGDGFIGFQMAREKKKLFSTIQIYDASLNKVTEVFRYPFWIGDRNTREINFFERANGSIPFWVHASKIFVSRGGSQSFIIDVYDNRGKKLNSITHPSAPIKIPPTFVKRVHDYFRVKFKRGLEHNIKYTTYGESFPAIRKFTVNDNKIYVLSYKRADGKNQLLILDFSGNLLQNMMIPVVEKNPENLYPFSISKGIFYQLVENEDTEEWELHSVQLK